MEVTTMLRNVMFRNVLAVALLGFATGALADGPGAAPPASSPQAAPAPAGQDGMPDASAVCPQDTGSHIKRKPGDCLSSPGRTYGSQEISQTGATDVGGALRMMDPSLTTSR
jgi:hypothetical protein